MSMIIQGETIAVGAARGQLLHLREPLSFYGGLDLETGSVMDRRHPQLGVRLADRVLLMAIGRGSSSGSSVLAEAIRRGIAPAAIIMRVRDPIIAVGVLVAAELYRRELPVLLVDDDGQLVATHCRRWENGGSFG